MQVGRGRSTTGGSVARNGVISVGPVLESRMKTTDEVKGGVKVFNGEENSSTGIGNVGSGGSRIQVYSRLKRHQSSGMSERRKAWTSEPAATGNKGIERSPIQLRKTRSDSQRVPVESHKQVDSNSVEAIEKNPIQIKKTTTTTTTTTTSRSDSGGNCKDVDVCNDKTISISSSNVGQIRNQGLIKGLEHEDDDDDGVDGDEEDEGEEDEEMVEDTTTDSELQKNSFDDKEINIEEQKPKVVVNQTPISITSNASKQSLKVINHPAIDPDLRKSPPKKSSTTTAAAAVKEIAVAEQKPRKVIIEEKKITQTIKAALPISSKFGRRSPQVVNLPATDPGFRKTPTISVSYSESFDKYPETQSKLQNIVDLVMWRDVSKSALVFGFGTFVLLSSSYTEDVNFSLISAVSYMGLVYLAAIFLHRSFLCRGVAVDFDDSNKRSVVGEEEAIWLLRFILPYLNEFLLKLRGLFSGDPATTMKLAVLLFILARCGSSITIWKVAKLGFFGVFTVPKICSSYSTQLTGYGMFWVRRFQDAWNSCTHKKAVAAAVFTLIWNMSSVVARVWALFMLLVAVRYYQQSLVIDRGWEAEEDNDTYTCAEQNVQRHQQDAIAEAEK